MQIYKFNNIKKRALVILIYIKIVKKKKIFDKI